MPRMLAWCTGGAHSESRHARQRLVAVRSNADAFWPRRAGVDGLASARGDLRELRAGDA